MSEILLTGSSGFIGEALLNYIKTETSEFDKLVLLSSKKHDFLNTIIYNKEYFKIPKIPAIDSVIHLGAFIPKQSNQMNDVNLCFSNIDFTSKLINALPTTNLKRFVFISSVDVYDSDVDRIDESSNTKPASLYGWSKLYCEQMIIEWCKRYNVSYIILRLGHIYGAGEEEYKKFIPVTILNLQQNIAPKIFTNGLEKRSFLHVYDCVHYIWNSLSINNNEIINIVSSNSNSILEIANILIKISKKPLMPEVLNNQNNPRDLNFDNSKMIKLFGKETMSIEIGLEKEYIYFLSNKNENIF